MSNVDNWWLMSLSQMYVSAKWRESYDRVFTSLRRREQEVSGVMHSRATMMNPMYNIRMYPLMPQSRSRPERAARASERKMQPGRVPERRLLRAALR